MDCVRRIAILGSTGSIGRQALDVIRQSPQRARVVGLAGETNITLLETQIEEFQARMFWSSMRPGSSHGAELLPMEEIAAHPDVDLVIVATSGKSGLAPTLAALGQGKTCALASKEVLVMAGDLVLREAKRHNADLLPIDSEHSAIWQCLLGEDTSPQRLILTASGGPFYRHSRSQLQEVNAEQALSHPTWKMGPKVTIDSATLMNKGLEVIEAHWLFTLPFDRIAVLIHPQSIIHSMVEFVDGSVKAQLSYPDMRLPIQYALSHPQRWPNAELPRLSWDKIRQLSFEPADRQRFPCLELALEAGRSGGTYPAALCAADEVAVDFFLRGEIGFTDMGPLIEGALSRHRNVANPTLDDIVEADRLAREYTARQGGMASR